MKLPEHRKMINGHTHDSMYDPTSFDPIDRPPRRWTSAEIADWIILGIFVFTILYIGKEYL